MMGILTDSNAARKSWRSSKTFISIVVNLAVFTDAYLYGLIIPVLPFALTEVVKIDADDLQWWIGALLAAYGIGLMVGAPIVGYYADRSGSRRFPYLFGLVSLTISTVAISLGRTTWILLVGRLIQGASSASVHAVGMAILADTVVGNGSGTAIGFVSMMVAVGAVLGPMVGGLLYHNFGYSGVFLSAYILVAVDFAFRFLMIEKKRGSKSARIENYGTLSEVHTSGGSVIDEPHEQCNWAEPNLAPPHSSGSIKDRQTSFRYPIFELLAMPRMLAAILGDFMQSLILTGLETTLPLRIKTVFSYNSQDVAFVFLFLAIPFGAGPLIGKISDLYGPKAIVSVGFAALMPLIMMLRLVDHFEQGQVALLCVLLLAIGTALNMVLTPIWSDIMCLVDDKSHEEPGIFGEKGAYAQAFALMNMAYAVGSVLGPLLSGLLMDKVGWSWTTLGTGVLCGLCIIPCVMFVGGERQRKLF